MSLWGETVLILIAEDERPIAGVVAAVVADAGFEPAVATHGRRALELARERWPALVITDLMMPYLDGAELIAALGAEAAARGVARPPVILMTAAGLGHAGQAGADAVLRKPFDLDALDALIQLLLGPKA